MAETQRRGASGHVKVLFVNDSTSNANWGDRAAAVSLLAMVRASGGDIMRAVTEAELRSSRFDAGPDAISDLPGPVRNERLRELVKQVTPPLLLDARRRLLGGREGRDPAQLIPRRWEDFEVCAQAVRRTTAHGWPAMLSALAEADVVVIHGDGAMVGCDVIPRTDLFVAYLAKRHFATPVTIVNHTVDLDHPDLLRMAAEVYPLFDDVVYRDPMSADRWGSVCGGRPAADTAFWFEPAPRDDWAPLAARPTYFDVWPHTAGFDPSRPYICVGGSSILWAGWDPPALARGFAGLVEAVRAIYSGQVVLTASDLPDEQVLGWVARRLKLPLVGVTTPVQQAVDIVGNADAYIGGRWHPAIFALRGGAPVVALSSKTFKMRALMRAAGLPETEVDALDLATGRDTLLSLLRSHLEAGPELRGRLREWAGREAERCWDNVSYLQRHRPDRGESHREGRGRRVAGAPKRVSR
jgi:hypothetical protein